MPYFRGHLEQEAVVFGVAPVEVLGDGIGGGWGTGSRNVGGCAPDHDVDERRFTISISSGTRRRRKSTSFRPTMAFWSARSAGQVQSRVMLENRRSVPCAGRRADAVHEGSDALLDFLLAEAVDLHEGREIGVKAGECS